jgi:hypothetical protein
LRINLICITITESNKQPMTPREKEIQKRISMRTSKQIKRLEKLICDEAKEKALDSGEEYGEFEIKFPDIEENEGFRGETFLVKYHVEFSESNYEPETNSCDQTAEVIDIEYTLIREDGEGETEYI